MFLVRTELIAALIAALSFAPVVRGGGWWDHDYSSSSSSSDSSSSDSHDYYLDSVAEIACGGHYEHLCEAIERAGLYDRLDNYHEHATAFLPTDKAFEELFDYLHVDDVHDIPTRKLRDVILLHFHLGEELYKDDLKHRCTHLLKMTNGDYTRTICKDDKKKLFQKGNGNLDEDRPRIIEFDYEAWNGVVHTVDEVILPGHMAPKSECESITEIVCGDKDFDILCHALIYTDLDDDLDEEEWTLFAPTDDSFHELIDLFDLHSVTDLGKEDLTHLLLFHVVSDDLKYRDIECGEDLEMASGECSRTKCNYNNGHKFQRGACNNRDDRNVPRIIQKDIKACNGYIQVVEDVLLPEAFCHR